MISNLSICLIIRTHAALLSQQHPYRHDLTCTRPRFHPNAFWKQRQRPMRGRARFLAREEPPPAEPPYRRHRVLRHRLHWCSQHAQNLARNCVQDQHLTLSSTIIDDDFLTCYLPTSHGPIEEAVAVLVKAGCPLESCTYEPPWPAQVLHSLTQG
jgi:hypothetical protein